MDGEGAGLAAVADRDAGRLLRRPGPRRRGPRRCGHRPVPAPLPVRGARRDGAGDLHRVRAAGVAQLRPGHDRRPRRRHGGTPPAPRRGPARGHGDARDPGARRPRRTRARAGHRWRHPVGARGRRRGGPADGRRAAARGRRAADERADHVLPRPATGPDGRCAAAPGRHRRAGRQHDGADRGRAGLLRRRAPAGGVVDRRDPGVHRARRARGASRAGPDLGGSAPTTGCTCTPPRSTRRCRCSRRGARSVATSISGRTCSSPATTATPRPPRGRW